MELTNEFRVGVPISEAWKVLTDVERIAPFLPGAQLQEVDGDEYRGVVKVKVGPITAQYKGQATIIDQDEKAGRVVLRASGRDTRGQGNATADITATMAPDGDATKVTVVTDLTVTGKVAQFGRGVLAEVSAKLMGQFVDALEADLAGSGETSPPPPPAMPSSDAPPPTNGPSPVGEVTPSDTNGDAGGTRPVESSGPRRIESAEAEPVDLISVAGGSALKRVGPLAALALVVAVVLIRRRAHRAARQLNWLASNLATVGEVATRPARSKR